MAKRRRTKRGSRPLWLVILILAAAMVSRFLDGNFYGQSVRSNYHLTGEEGELQVHFIDVGQGDATLIFQEDHAMLIDAGDNGCGWQVVDYLDYLGIEQLDYVIGTHPDSDHIGGLDTVIENISCDMVMMPDLEKDTKTYESVADALKAQGKESVSPKPGEEYSLGTAVFTVLAPLDSYSGANDNSIAIRLVHGENSFLFTGDAEEASEEDMMDSGRALSSDVYKVAHHGSATANTESFLWEVNPTYAVISCGEGNSYGHPHSEVLNRLRSMGVKVFRTDEQGTIVAVSDGSEITFNMSPSESWQAGN